MDQSCDQWWATGGTIFVSLAYSGTQDQQLQWPPGWSYQKTKDPRTECLDGVRERESFVMLISLLSLKKKKKKIYSSSNLVSSLKMQYAGKSEYFSPVFQFDKLFLFFVLVCGSWNYCSKQNDEFLKTPSLCSVVISFIYAVILLFQ